MVLDPHKKSKETATSISSYKVRNKTMIIKVYRSMNINKTRL